MTLAVPFPSLRGAARCACACALAVACAMGSDDAAQKLRKPQDIYPFLDLFASCVAIVQSDYAEDVNPTNLMFGALHGMMRSLDPHSEFMEAEATDQLKIDTEGEFVGIGIEIGMRDDTICVIAPIEGTPAFKAGLMPNDRIIKVGHESTRDMTIGDAVKQLRGKKGTQVRITVMRLLKSTRETKEFTITRDVIKVQSVRDARIVDVTNHVGYVRVTSFDRTTADELGAAIDGLVTQGLDALVLDLRNNGGGLLSEAIDLTSMFLDTTQIVVSTRGRIETQNQVYYAVEEGPKYRMPLAVLVNGASASASEIVCGAVKDHRRGFVVGSRTFGKGSVQTVLPVGNNCSLRLTTAKYYTPSGVCIHGTGIFPTIEVAITIDDEIKLIEKRSSLHTKADLPSMSKEERARFDELIAFRDAQLDRAVDTLAAMRFMDGSPYMAFPRRTPDAVPASTNAAPVPPAAGTNSPAHTSP